MSFPKLTATITFGNLATVISIIFAAGLGWGSLNSAIDEAKIMREQDLRRIELVEAGHTKLEYKIQALENQSTKVSVSLEYIKEGLDEIKEKLKTDVKSK